MAPRILIVDDEESVTITMAAILEMAGDGPGLLIAAFTLAGTGITT